MKQKAEKAASHLSSFFAAPNSDTHLNAQRSNGVAEVLNAGLLSLNSAATIGPKFAQLLIGFWVVAHPKCNFPEKCIGLLQLLIAGGQLCTAIGLLFLDEQCDTTDSNLCKTALVLALLYQGILLTGWVPSEASQMRSNSNPIPSIKAKNLKTSENEVNEKDIEVGYHQYT